MFWGLTLKANKRYSQTLKKAFHLSNAALDIPSCTDNEVVQLIIEHDGHSYVICNLKKNKVEQVALDLSFAEGEEIAFTSQGQGNIHLTGYLLLEDDVDSDDESDLQQMLQQQLSGKKGNDLKRKFESVKKDEDSEDEGDNDDDDDDEDDEDDGDMDLGESESDDDDDEDEDEDDDGEDGSEDEKAQEPKPKHMKLDKVKQNGLENGAIGAKEAGKKEKKKKDKQNKEQQQQQQKPQQNQQKQKQQEKSPKGGEKTLQGGVKIHDIQVGTGPEAKPGKKLQVYYEGRLKSNNKVFDSTKEGKGFKFALGKSEVIKGWDIGVAGMKVGGKRRITCPPHVAYGAKGHPPVIPPNSTLVFEVELKGVN